MKSLNSIAFSLSLALVACGTDHGKTGQQEAASNDNGQVDNGTGGGGVPATCPLGAGAFSAELALSSPEQQLSLAVDAGGNVMVAGSSADASAPGFIGVDHISASGQAAIALPFGSLVATDGAGNTFVAGSFTASIDFGNGLVLQPSGAIDVFVAEIDAKGHVVFARALDQCGDGVAAMAIGKGGLIAVSGSAMGTVVLSANGDLMFQVAESGQLAFDSKGDLVIAGSSSDAAQAFVAMVDVSGAFVFNNMIDGTAAITGVGIDANDNIFLVGFTTDRASFFGNEIVAHFAIEPGRVTGAFMVELSNSCVALMLKDLGIVEANGIAIDANGQIFIAGAITGNLAFDRYLDLVRIDVRGVMTSVALGSGDVIGRVLAVSVDACGAVYAGVVRQDVPSAGAAINALVLKVSL